MNDGILIELVERFLDYIDLVILDDIVEEDIIEQLTIWKEGICVNCDHKPSTGASLFCSDVCKQEAKFIRYARATRKDGRIDQPDIRLALAKRLIFAMNNG